MKSSWQILCEELKGHNPPLTVGNSWDIPGLQVIISRSLKHCHQNTTTVELAHSGDHMLCNRRNLRTTTKTQRSQNQPQQQQQYSYWRGKEPKAEDRARIFLEILCFVLKFHSNVAFPSVFHGVCFMMERMASPKRPNPLKEDSGWGRGHSHFQHRESVLIGKERPCPCSEYKGRIQEYLENGI